MSDDLRRQRLTRLADARLYLCTDSRRERGDLEGFLEAVLAGGVDIVQLREKGLEAQEEMALAQVVTGIAHRHGALASVNDRADIAATVRPDILHLGQDDLPVAAARRLVGPDILIGRSTHTPAQADEAAADAEVDYFCTGPTWTTPTKPGRAAAGLELVEHAAATVTSDRPWFAIGGIEQARLDAVLAAGARRIVVVRALTDAEDPEQAARRLADRLRG